MATLVWKDQYSVKVMEIDNQHKKLFDLINKLDAHMRQGKGKEILGTVLKELVDYTRYHFGHEERILRESGYPEYEEHKAIHERVTERVLAIQKQYLEGNGAHLTIDAMNYLNNWITKHILGTDQKYTAHVNAKGIS